MKLSRYLRQHSRGLLMVFMAFLLVAFLVPQSIQSIGETTGRGNAVRGQAFGHKVTSADLQQAAADLRLVHLLGLAQDLPADAVVEFYLLTEEARRSGIRVGHDAVKAELLRRHVTDDHLRELQRRTQRGFDRIYDALARWLAVDRLRGLQAGGNVDSLPRQELAYRDQKQRGVADFATLDDRAFRALVPEPSEEELQAFFEAGKNRVTAHSTDKLEFGYLLPDRVQIEYLTVDPQKARNKITLQTAQVRRFFEENAQRYMKPDPSASQPATGRVPQVPMTFEEAKERVREDCREARAIEVAQSLVNDMYTEAHRPWASSTRTPEGFLRPPETGDISFEDLKQRYSATYEVDYGKTALMGVEELAALAGIGRAGYSTGRQLVQFPELALRVQGILARDPQDGKPVFSVMEPAPVVLTPKSDAPTPGQAPPQAYLFRVIRAEPSAPPASLDEVRDRVVEDWKLTRAHELAGQHAEALAAAARQVGLRAAVEQAVELRAILAAAEAAASPSSSADATASAPAVRYLEQLQPFTAEFTRWENEVGSLGRVPHVVRALFALAGTGDESSKPVTSQPVADQNKWVVAELLQVKPIYQAAFDAQLLQSLVGTFRWDLRRYDWEWLSPQNVRERTGFSSPTAPTDAPDLP